MPSYISLLTRHQPYLTMSEWPSQPHSQTRSISPSACLISCISFSPIHFPLTSRSLSLHLDLSLCIFLHLALSLCSSRISICHSISYFQVCFVVFALRFFLFRCISSLILSISLFLPFPISDRGFLPFSISKVWIVAESFCFFDEMIFRRSYVVAFFTDMLMNIWICALFKGTNCLRVIHNHEHSVNLLYMRSMRAEAARANPASLVESTHLWAKSLRSGFRDRDTLHPTPCSSPKALEGVWADLSWMLLFLTFVGCNHVAAAWGEAAIFVSLSLVSGLLVCKHSNSLFYWLLALKCLGYVDFVNFNSWNHHLVVANSIKWLLNSFWI